MLARMLRFTIVLQLLAGAALGFWLIRAPAAVVLAGMALPLASVGLAVICSFCVSRADEAPALWWQALLGELPIAIRTFLLRQPWAFAPPAILAPTAGPARLPVLLLHGFVCNGRAWDDMLPALRAQGHAVLAIHLEPVFTSLDDYAPLLEQAVQTLRLHTGQDRVALLGHSMGGLAIRAWMRRYGTTQAAIAITLGTPHAGTRLRSPQRLRNGVQMAWQGAWLQQLAAIETDATRSLFRIALSAQDNIVFPQRAQTLAGVTPVVFEGLGHLQLCSAARVRAWVCSELRLL